MHPLPPLPIALNSLKTRPVVEVKQFDLNNGTLEKLYEQDEIGATAEVMARKEWCHLMNLFLVSATTAPTISRCRCFDIKFE